MSDNDLANTAPNTMRRILRGAYRRLRAALALVGLLTIIYFTCFDLSTVLSPSMQPTLRGSSDGGDWVLAEKISYWFRKPRRFEVVRFYNNDGIQVMKRVGGLPAETIRLVDGKIIANGQAVDVPLSLSFLHYYAYGPLLYNGKAASCGEGYIVLGDDSRDSQDSRYDGPLAPKRIRGRAWLIVWPPSRFGFVNP
jgi:signal peptidase I